MFAPQSSEAADSGGFTRVSTRRERLIIQANYFSISDQRPSAFIRGKIVLRAAGLCYDSLLALVYPQACAICGASVESRGLGVACASCWKRTAIFTRAETVCWKCGIPAAGNVPFEKREQVRCRRCDHDAYTMARACGIYESALRASALSLKRDPHVPRKLSEHLLATTAQFPLNTFTRIIPVPLHPRRLKARGFNQASMIARELARAITLPVDEVSLVRTEHTERHRVGMDAKDRKKTVNEAFAVRYPALVSGETILLVDDVFTTGATVASCAKTLLEAGASKVFVLTIARAVR